VEDAENEVIVRRRPALFDSPEFAELWRRIRYRARYRVSVDAETLSQALPESEHLADLLLIQRRANVVQSADLAYDDTGRVATEDAAVAESRGERILLVGQRLWDVVQLIVEIGRALV